VTPRDEKDRIPPRTLLPPVTSFASCAPRGCADRGRGQAPPRVSRLSFEERRRLLSAESADLAALLKRAEDPGALHELCGRMIENAFGFFALPWGLAEGFLIDGESFLIPMVTEEPSVIAAASFAAGLIRLGGGLQTEAEEARVTAQVWLERVPQAVYGACLARRRGRDAGSTLGKARAAEVSALEEGLSVRLAALTQEVLPSLAARGGGFVSCDLEALPECEGIVRVHIHLRVCDAMGANMANTLAEAARPLLEEACGGRALAAILTNECADTFGDAVRVARARFSLPVRILRRAGVSGEEIARRLVLFSEIAHHDRARAITANKGIMNGVTALALATGNDTRACEAAVHSFASRGGRYLPLSRYKLINTNLSGEIELPLPLASVSSTAKAHPAAALSLELLRRPGAPRLAAIAAALGLAQNLAALLALVGEGIQEGHMRLHARRDDGAD